MSVIVVWRDRAIHEAQDAFDWYEAKSQGLGERLLAELDVHVDALVQRPTGYPKWRGMYMKINLQRFPYIVVFRVLKNTVIIFSVFHNKRDPHRWGRPH
ncbi:MAG: type II toxin-antitoxin system RelE/ParE family toxin [Flavobacteriales bacterium]|nr:type II toxin-antitoxin system RelE/ParE family toxin [Flavobacteriales bacterium]MBP9080896.1 type II toxin-antitoxin system RelE/ParE family toxin [Flavobacteriales bacterium]